MDVVSAVLAQRTHDTERLLPVVGWSAVTHVVITLLLAIVPAGWLGARLADEPDVVMQISLGGAVGPRDGGLATLGGRPVQEAQPVEARKTIEPVRPPAAKAPEMVEPTKTLPRKQTPAAKVAAKDPRSRTPTRGEEVQAGNAVAQTAGQGAGFGLSAGGGGTGGYLDVANFCCPDYLATMIDLINRNWDSRQGSEGTTLMKFVIERDGRITGVEVEQSSGAPALDYFAQRALGLTRQLPPLPPAYTETRLTVHLNFGYSR
ncbi:MAG: energy transducer TonB [Acidobacteria bacterium]|nr:energy transducer TonB [Acidobacteriota bacterium]